MEKLKEKNPPPEISTARNRPVNIFIYFLLVVFLGGHIQSSSAQSFCII